MGETVYGSAGVSATVLLDSVTIGGIRMLTFESTYPRIIHSELMTHRALSKNAASSRAIPFNKMKEQLTGRPVRFGEANPGMQDKGEDFNAPVLLDEFLLRDRLADGGEVIDQIEIPYTPEQAWESAKYDALRHSEAFYKAGYHKQVYNRLTEAFQVMKTVISGTEWGNFHWLRDDGAADPTIAELARCKREAKDASEPFLLHAGEYHLPYVNRYRDEKGVLHYFDTDDLFTRHYYSLQDAIKISAARCAAVSFRNVDYGLEKSLEVHARLIGDERKHSSALEHQATPMAQRSWDIETESGINISHMPYTWEEGVSHSDRKGQLWSGNFRGFIQYRKLIPGENKSEY